MNYIEELTAVAKAHGGIIETKIAAQQGVSKAMLYKLCKDSILCKDKESIKERNQG